jgi:hypothetical protein
MLRVLQAHLVQVLRHHIWPGPHKTITAVQCFVGLTCMSLPTHLPFSCGGRNNPLGPCCCREAAPFVPVRALFTGGSGRVEPVLGLSRFAPTRMPACKLVHTEHVSRGHCMLVCPAWLRAWQPAGELAGQ